MEHRFNTICEYIPDVSECIYKNHTHIFNICMMRNQIQNDKNENNLNTFLYLTFFYIETNQFAILLSLLTGIIYVYLY